VVDVPQHFYHVLSDAYHVVIMWVSDVSKKYPDVCQMFSDVFSRGNVDNGLRIEQQ
jgi:hypothetical protein